MKKVIYIIFLLLVVTMPLYSGIVGFAFQVLFGALLIALVLVLGLLLLTKAFAFDTHYSANPKYKGWFLRSLLIGAGLCLIGVVGIFLTKPTMRISNSEVKLQRRAVFVAGGLLACKTCGHLCETDRGCPPQIMKTYPHVKFREIRDVIDKDAEEFAKKHVLMQDVYKKWGPPKSDKIFNKKDNPTSGDLDLGGDKLHRVVTYGVYHVWYSFGIDRQGCVLAWTYAESIGDYWCPKCGENYGEYVRIVPVY